MENINALKGSMSFNKFAAFNVKADTVKAAQKKRRQPERVKTGGKVHARKMQILQNGRGMKPNHKEVRT
ncbi:hypothetical protein [Sporofaciens sp. JLR.KK001]|uniref:hypothetical protein n=1 Tax=Sporofaciens sp. JLR.KK001 TaxID=3112621 RepID=UPI002FF38005